MLNGRAMPAVLRIVEKRHSLVAIDTQLVALSNLGKHIFRDLFRAMALVGDGEAAE